MYLLIFESIGTSELILIGIIALIIFGPRKLPEMMKTFGKVMADFKRSTNEFKESWEREVAFENSEKEKTEEKNLLDDGTENSIGRNSYPLENEIVAPEIKEINSEDFEKNIVNEESSISDNSESENKTGEEVEKTDLSNKRDWL